MDAAFWKSRWAEGRIGFHEGKPNRYLERHHDKLATFPRVLVPLCGKAEDLAYLAAHGHDVVGVEIVEDAVQAFFAEHGLTPEVVPQGAFVEYTAPSIKIYVGDMFDAKRAVLGQIDAIWDRGALVALPDDIRRRYVDHLRSLAPKRVLQLTVEYDQQLMSGPPFSVEEAELRALYDNCDVEFLSEGPDPRDRGPDSPAAFERCFSITL
jgi:thiopurine S-methyltransferase